MIKEKSKCKEIKLGIISLLSLFKNKILKSEVKKWIGNMKVEEYIAKVKQGN